MEDLSINENELTFVDNGVDSKKKKKILIIDDDDVSRMILRELLANHYAISEASNGSTGIEIAKENDIDLILLDINMPDINGFEVCTLLKNSDETENIPIIFLTAKSGTVDKTKAFMLGATDYITKPFESEEMLARIETHLKLIDEMQNLTSYNNRLNILLKEQTRELIRTERHALFSVMIKGIVHNLRNPLGAMMGANDLVVHNVKEAIESGKKGEVMKALEKIDKFSSMIKTSITNLNDMVNSMLAKSRQDNIDHIENFNLADIIQKEIEFMSSDRRFEAYLGDRYKILHSHLPVEAVPSEIAQIFHNLVSNAIDALYNQSDSQIEIELGKENNMAYFKVSDNGPGIKDEVKERIFEPFFTTKESNPNRNRPPGTGLGLYTSKEIISKFRGRIELETEIGKGTTFTIFLPIVNSLN
ncbi:MAG: sensor histidine kinase [Candidatus Zixiibacteriota bacterium]